MEKIRKVNFNSIYGVVEMDAVEKTPAEACKLVFEQSAPSCIVAGNVALLGEGRRLDGIWEAEYWLPFNPTTGDWLTEKPIPDSGVIRFFPTELEKNELLRRQKKNVGAKCAIEKKKRLKTSFFCQKLKLN